MLQLPRAPGVRAARHSIQRTSETARVTPSPTPTRLVWAVTLGLAQRVFTRFEAATFFIKLRLRHKGFVKVCRENRPSNVYLRSYRVYVIRFVLFSIVLVIVWLVSG